MSAGTLSNGAANSRRFSLKRINRHPRRQLSRYSMMMITCYVFIRAYDTEPDKISRIMTRRDNLSGDLAGIFIDSYYDKQTSFCFIAMASGAKGDQAITQDGFYDDDSWNPIWFLGTSIDDKGWCAEMKIPLSQLQVWK